MAVAKAFTITSLPFILAEAATGAMSLATGLLPIPPLLGVGSAVDAAILVAGLVIVGVRALREKPPYVAGDGETG